MILTYSLCLFAYLFLAGWIGIPGYNWCYKFVENAPTSLTWLEAEQVSAMREGTLDCSLH